MQAGENDTDAITDINVTPLVDIALVLVIIFMITSPMVIQSGIVVTSSKVTASVGKSTKSEAVNVKITGTGVILNNKKVVQAQEGISEEDFNALLEKNFVPRAKNMLAKNEKKLVIVTSDRKVPHGWLVGVLDKSKMAGAKTISIMSEEKKK
ncbi:MAG: ExbD/TolR family protein [Candidatus Goldiibacteriota bacterium]